MYQQVSKKNQQQRRFHTPRAAKMPRFARVAGQPMRPQHQTMSNHGLLRRLAAEGIQPKLKVGAPKDRYEQEADRVAEQVMRMPEPQLQRACACGGTCSKCHAEHRSHEDEVLQPRRIRANDAEPTAAPSGVHDALRASGQPLDAATRAFFEPRFGADFSQVRVHTGGQASEAARSVQARAFTAGRDVVFDAGQYAPGTRWGKQLLAHELTHVMQQGQSVQVPGLQRQQVPPAEESESAQPLTDVQRNALFTELVGRMGRAFTKYDSAAQQVQDDLQAEATARADLVKLMVNVVAAFVVPGLGGAISRLVNNIPATASVGIHTLALGIQSQANNIAGAIGEVGKTAAGQAIDSAFSSSPRDFLNALVQGMSEIHGQIQAHIRRNIANQSALPNANLWLYVANWDDREITIPRYRTLIRNVYDRFETQVAAITPEQRTNVTDPIDRTIVTQTGIVWVQHSSGAVLVQARIRNGRMTFLRFIDADLKDLAIARAGTTQPRRVQTIPWNNRYIGNLPSSVPSNVARR